MLVGRTVNTYFAVLIITVIGGAAAHLIVRVATETYETPAVWAQSQAEYVQLQRELLN